MTNRSNVWLSGIVLLFEFVGCSARAQPADPPILHYLNSQKISSPKENFTEPSGLALATPSKNFWSVSDSTSALFLLSREGQILQRVNLGKHSDGLEGVAWDQRRGRLLAVREESAEVLVIDPQRPEKIERHSIADMEGYSVIAGKFSNSDKNNGLEGIAVFPETDTILLVKEKHPRLMLELTSDLTTIRGVLELSEKAGFSVPGISDEDLDVSDISYDSGRSAFWITSDTGRSVFLFDPRGGPAWQYPLESSNYGNNERFKNVEGVAVSADGSHLFVVSDDGPNSILADYNLD